MRSKLLFIANDFDIVIYRFRREVIEAFAAKEYEIILVTPYSNKVIDFCKSVGVEYINIDIDRRGKNPFKDLFLLFNYFKIIKKEKPDYIFSYTIKPNLYVGLVNLFFRKKFYPNVTGLGSVFANDGIIQKFIIFLYRLSFKNAIKVFFQNKQNKKLFIVKKIISEEKSILLPGSGVNLDENKYVEYPKDEGVLKFVFLGRIMKEKGIYELLEAFAILEKKYKNISLDIYGFCDENNVNFMQQINAIKSTNFCGFTDNTKEKIINAHAVVLPSYHEGMSNVMLEAAAIGRPIIASDIPGCREVFDDGISGLSCKPNDVTSLYESLEQFINMSYDDKIAMSVKARAKIEKDFDRSIVVKAYLQQL
ncbi:MULTISPECIES: glycosyltransferase family 4 protein [Francisella]|uniref:Glycosyltransferase family 1 protein n=1 Tax=Francisella opportunistica TaxID=2016517 RepID=A0A345JQ08_9GAMM|nr:MULTISPECIES: glycosyltransferase family 4 protein [Francisella]APC91093.1 Lipid carrier : UDP-N-acetylgalactosaminyltransferase / Alpha-1,3-N-acetylgalactosamine transferase PglA [Francisella sp. MA067296]AXH29404.1 glycosyltransferase family 1 protein [Francisella opportunistica]AXH31056.1 glycosyltransferase family 1 protein [Francisella opportunistica]AXH32701.1 glycosyltransferase family 1 protein [Francisella opportunistica]